MKKEDLQKIKYVVEAVRDYIREHKEVDWIDVVTGLVLINKIDYDSFYKIVTENKFLADKKNEKRKKN